MLIIDNKTLQDPLPLYEVQEVSMKQALALLKSSSSNSVEPLTQPDDIAMPMVNGVSADLQGMGSSTLQR